MAVIETRGSVTNKRIISTDALMTGYLTCFEKFKISSVFKARINNKYIFSSAGYIVKFGHAETHPLFLIWGFSL